MFWKRVLKVLESIAAGLLALAGAVCIIPVTIIYVLIDLPVTIISDIWGN